MAENDELTRNGISRRSFLKIGGVAGAALSLGGVAGAAFADGRDFDTYTGWEDIYEGGAQFFDRTPFRVDQPTYEVVGETQRIDPRTDMIFARHRRLSPYVDTWVEENNWTQDDDLQEAVEGVRDLLQEEDEVLADYYAQEENQDKLEKDLRRQLFYSPQQREDSAQYDARFELAMAWAGAWGAVRPDSPDSPPEEWDFRDMRAEPLVPKSEEKASQLIKKAAHTFGATLCSIGNFNPDWAYSRDIRGGEPGPFEVPEWWQTAIVVTTPHEWDQMAANPTYGTSSDAYARSSIAGARLAAFIRSLGYAARLHSPRNGYDVVVPPICVDTGLAQQGRFVFTITPELGPNHRPAVVTTNMPLQHDQPIDFGAHDFCKECKICADYCPSGAITFADEPDTVVRGYKRWSLDLEACYNFWGQVLGNGGCRVCLAVCPYSRKSNWVHDMARVVSTSDPTGLADKGLLWMQENFFEFPDAEAYYPPSYGGENASYRSGVDAHRRVV